MGSRSVLWDQLRPLQGAFLRIAALAAIVVAWQVAATDAATLWFPPFSVVVARIVAMFDSGQIQAAIVSSLANLVLGYLLAVIVGVATGTVMALSRRADYALRSYVDALLFIPPVVFAPVFFAFFGLSSLTLVSVVFVFAVFVIIQNTEIAIAAADRGLLDMATVFGASPWQRLREATIPAALPVIFAGLQLGMGRAVKGMIVSEIFISVVGLGGLERQFSSAFDSVGIWAIAVTVVSMAFILVTLVRVADRFVNGWAE